jgi:hypothetical protein
MRSEALNLLTVESVTAGLLVLVCEDAPNREILTAGAGAFARTIVYATDGIYLRPEELNAENVAAKWNKINDPAGQQELKQGSEQTVKFLTKAASALGIELG